MGGLNSTSFSFCRCDDTEIVACKGCKTLKTPLKTQFQDVLSFFEVAFDLKNIDFDHNNPVQGVICVFSSFDETQFLVAVLKFMFDYYDADGNGHLDVDEFRLVLGDVFHMVNKNKSGSVDDDECREFIEESMEEFRKIDSVSMRMDFATFVASRTIQKLIALSSAGVMICESEEDIDLSHVSPLQGKTLDAVTRILQSKLNNHASSREVLVGRLHSLMRFFGVSETGNVLEEICKVHDLFAAKKLSIDKSLQLKNEPQQENETKFNQTIFNEFGRFLFKFYDVNLDGYWQKNELIQFLHDVNETLPEEEKMGDVKDFVTAFLDDMDENKDGKIEFSEIEKFFPTIFTRLSS